MLLIVDCCMRGEASTTRRYYQAYLQKRGLGAADVEVLELAKLGLAPLYAEDLAGRDALRAQGAYGDEMFALARQFRDAEEILVAAPYWDLSFPSLLKVYVEHVSVCDLTFGYDETGRPEGYCKAERLLYFSSCGGYVGAHHLGYEYMRAFAAMLGIEHSEAYTLEGMDIDPSQREALLAEAIARL